MLKNMMNFKISNRLLTEYFLHNNHRLLNVQKNVNKCSIAHYSINSERKSQSNTSCYTFSKHLLEKNFYSLPTTPLYTNIHRRHLSDHDLIKNAQPPPTPQVNPETIPEPIFDPNEAAMYLPEFLINATQENPFLFVQDIIIQLHQEMGLSWCATLMIAAVFMRTALLPVSVIQIRNKTKLHSMRSHLVVYKNKLKTEMKEYSLHYGWPEEIFSQRYDKRIRKEEENLFKTMKCHPNKNHLASYTNFLAWFTCTFAIRNLCNALPPSVDAVQIFREMSFDGYSWFFDLTVADPYMILPIIWSILNGVFIESQRLFCLDQGATNEQVKYLSAHVANLAMVPISVISPAAVVLFWISWSTYRLGEVYLLHSPIVQRILRMPPLGDKKPYGFYYTLLKSRLADYRSK